MEISRTSKDYALSQDEREELISMCKNPTEKFIILGLMFTGMRVSEFANLKNSWIRWQDKYIRIPKSEDKWSPKTMKGNRCIPILEPRFEGILGWWFGQFESVEMHRSTIFRVVKRVASRTTIKRKVYPHALRSTFANILTEKGMSTFTIQHILGWAKISTAEHYIQDSGIRALKEAKERW
jgi:integrase